MAVVLHDNGHDKMIIQRIVVHYYNSTNTPSSTTTPSTYNSVFLEQITISY